MNPRSSKPTAAPLLASAVLLALLLPPTPLQAEAECWANDGKGNMVLEAHNLPSSLSEEQILWNIDSGTKHQYPKPEAVGDKVLLMGDGGGNPDPFWGEAVSKGGSVVCRSLETGEQLWRLVVPGTGYGPATYGVCGSPVVLGDRVYIVALYDVFCLDLNGLADGNQGAQNELELMMREGYTLPEGETAPTDLPSWAADVIWHYDMKPLGIDVQDATSCTPVAVDGQLWVSTAHQMGYEARGRNPWRENEEGKKVKIPDEYLPNIPAPNLIVLDLESGELLAKDDLQVPIVYHGAWSSPALLEAGGEKAIVYPDGYGVLHGFAIPKTTPGGEPVVMKELWSLDLNPPEYRYNEAGQRHPYTFHIGQLDYKYPLSWPRGEEWIPFPETGFNTLAIPGGPSEVIAVPAVVGNRVYVGIGRDHNYDYGEIPEDRGIANPRGRKFGLGRFVCLEFEDIRTPRIAWEDRDVARMQASASIADGLVYVVDNAGFLNCWDAETGEVLYKADVGTKMHERSQVVADGKIYFGDDRGFLQIWKAGPEPVLLDGSYRIGPHPSTVEAFNGGLILATGKDVTVFRNTNTQAQNP